MVVSRAFALAVLVAGLGAAPAFATPTGLFGNTLQITAPNGTVSKVYVNSDSSYSRVDSAGNTTSGTWAETEDQMCFTQTSPTQGQALCGPVITQSAGQSWSGTRPDGTISQLTILSGR
jgi:hypothetical protein